MDGLQATTLLRQTMRRPVPAIILTGDISTAALRNVALQDCIYLSKPVKLENWYGRSDGSWHRRDSRTPAHCLPLRGARYLCGGR